VKGFLLLPRKNEGKNHYGLARRLALPIEQEGMAT
jgi:hypothetical protein